MAMVVIVAGVVIASVYGPKNETSPTMAVVRLVRRPAFLCPVLSAVGLAGVTTCLLLLKLLKPRRTSR